MIAGQVPAYVLGPGRVARTADASVGDVLTWTSRTNLPAPRFGSTAVSSSGFTYVIGGAGFTVSETGGGAVTESVNTVFRATVQADGSLAGFTTVAALSVSRMYPAAIVHGGYIYVFGGYGGGNAKNDWTARGTIERAVINADGSLGAWSTLPTTLSSARAGMGIFSPDTSTRLYLAGGETGFGTTSQAALATVESMDFASLDGTTAATWQAEASLPGARRSAVTVGIGQRALVTGGYDPSGQVTKTVFRADVQADGSVVWSTDPIGLPVLQGIAAHAAAYNNGFLYIAGGVGNSTNTMNWIAVKADQTLSGGWHMYPSTSSDAPFATTTDSPMLSVGQDLYYFAHNFARTDTLEITLQAATADLSAGIRAIPATVAPGASVAVTATVTNLGSDPANNVVLYVTLPTSLAATAFSASQGSCAFPQSLLLVEVVVLVTTQTLQCSLGSLAPGASASATVQVTTPSTEGTYQVTNAVASDTRDSNPDNNVASASITAVVGVIGVASCNGKVLPGATVELLSGTSVVATTHAAPDGTYWFKGLAPNTTFGLRYTSADGLIVCGATVQTDASGLGTVVVVSVPNLHNSTWPTAYALGPDGAPMQDYIAVPRDAWFKVAIGPSQQIVVSLRDCAFDCSLVLYTDIAAAAAALQSGTIENVQRTQQQISPAELSPAELSPAELSPAELSPAELSPAELSPAELSPAELSAMAYSAAQTQSILAVSAHAGLSPELIIRNTWEHTGNFYVRVLSHTGDLSTQPFTVSARVLPGACIGVDLTKTPSVLAGGGATTLYITNSSRLLPTAAMTVPQFMSRLANFATRNGGSVVDLAADSGIQANYARWDAHESCAIAANVVADSIHDLIGRYPSLRYIALAGGDNVVPFRRVPDFAGLGNESTYHVPVLDSSESQAALKSGYFLSQDFYASPDPILRGNLRIDLPTQAIGRLVESVSDMTAMLDAYDLANGVASPRTAVSTGYDFVADLAHDLQQMFKAEGLTGAAGAEPDTLIEESGLGPTAPSAWTATQLRNVLFGPNAYGIYAIDGHFSANRALAADYATLVGSNELAALAATDLRFQNALILSMGCHAAYSIVDADGIPNLTQTVAWAEAFNARGATVVGGTGYGYGDSDFVQYSELILSKTAKALGAAGGPVAIGDALRNAKTDYLASLASPAGIDVKAEAEATLYGLPMMKFAVPTMASGTSDGTSLTLHPGTSGGLQFVDPSLTYGTTLHTDTIPIVGSTATVPLSYYDADGQIQVSPLQPILPRSVTPLPLPSSVVLRGGALISARYTETTPFFPRTDVATTEVRGELPTAFASVFTPLRLFSLNQIGGRSLVVTPAQYLTDGATGTARLYDAANLHLRLYTSTRTDLSALAAAPSITNVVLTQTTTGVHVDAVIGGLSAAGVEDVLFTYTTGADPTTHIGTWSSLSLRDGGLVADRAESGGDGFSEHVSGDIAPSAPAAVRLFVQAVSGNAQVSVASDAGAYFRLQPVSVTAATPKQPSNLEFTSAPSASTTYGDTILATVRLTSAGTAKDGKVVDFSFGGHHARTITAGGGFATAHFAASFDPVGSPYFFRVSFPEDAELLASSVSADVTITPATSTLTAAPLNVQYGGSAILEAHLAANGVPLNEELVVVTVKVGANVIAQGALLTNGFGNADFDTRAFGTLPANAYIATLSYGGSDFYTPTSTDVSFVVFDATTGGGWILTTTSTTPTGSVTLPAGKKANFGFNAKYTNGSSIPTGNAIFQLREASLDFRSTGIDGLSLSSTTVVITGTGTINGAGSYRFQITAVQGSPSQFEIRIWDPSATSGYSFDHPKYIASNALGGGSIKIH